MPPSSAALARRYGTDSVTTASPARLVVMLYDRLLRDLRTAAAALESRQIEASHHALIHAQEVLAELSGSLDLRLWPEGEPLARLYAYLQEQLVQANVHKDPTPVADCLEIVERLREAWSQALLAPAVAVAVAP